jgi:histone H3/H4
MTDVTTPVAQEEVETKEETISSLVIASKVKEYIKAKGLRVDGGFCAAASQMVADRLDRAVQRCTANKRQTVRPEDL